MQNGYQPPRTGRPDETEPAVTVSGDDYLYFVERAVRGMAGIVTELGDELCCARPCLPGANSAYGLVTHCLGVLDYWGGRLVAGRPVHRDRAAEFDATGTVADLMRQVDDALRRLRADVAGSSSYAPLAGEPDPAALGPDRPLTQGAALVHLYEEVAQHHGQLQVLRDVLRGAVRAPGSFDEAPVEWLRGKRGVKWHRPGAGLIPAWVADMDYPVAPAVRAAIEAALDRGDLGYPDWPEHPLAEPFARRMHTRYGWTPDPGHVRGVTDLLQALQVVLTLGSRPGDGVVAFTPNYPPFLATIARMGRALIPVPLRLVGPVWTWDHDRLEADLARHGGARVLLLVNPHNPTGKVFTRPELARVAELARRHDLIVISDEIHAELVHAPARHVPFAALGPEAAARAVTVTSATKAFNLAGLRTAVAHVGPAAVRTEWDALPPDLLGATNVLGVEATLAAWSQGGEWLTALRAHLCAQRDHLTGRIAAIPGVAMRRPDAGYLAWLELADADLPADPAAWLREHAGGELSPGGDFGPGNEHRARLNFATTRPLLDEILDRVHDALAGVSTSPAGR